MTSDRSAPCVLSWRLAGRKVVVVGGGSIGTAKVELLLATGAKIVVVDPVPSDRVVELAGMGRVTLRRRRARFFDLLGTRLLVAATGCTDTNRRLGFMARCCGAVVNAVDDQANCDVTVPAIIRRGPATIAITTDGSTPAGARFLREEVTAVVDQALSERLGEVLIGAAEARKDLRASGRYTSDYYRWRDRYFAPALDIAASGGDLGPLRHRFVERFTHPDPVPKLGRVTLVGAGPGGADLITVRGARALAGADVVIYDRLADPELLDLAPPAAERIPVGKGKGHGATQEAINALLVERATAGANVVRLKGGDPFVFGRGQEEVDAATDARVPVEVVPGLSSAVAAPALAGIPLTDRRVAASFTVLTGHRATPDGASDPDLVAASAGTGTVVVLMAATSASAVASSLVAGGRSGDLPVAFVHAAGTAAEQLSRSTLGQVAGTGCPFPAPTVMVVGEVVSMMAERPVERRGSGSTDGWTPGALSMVRESVAAPGERVA